MKRILSLTLSLILILTVVLTVSCSSQSEEVFDVSFETDLQVDLTGQHYRWGSTWKAEIMPDAFYSLTGDREHKRIRDLEEKYGCTFEAIAWEDGGNRIFTEFAAGIDTIDLLDSHADAGGIQLYRLNLLYPIEDIPHVDLSTGKYGTARFLQYGIFDGMHYGFYHFSWEFPPEYHGLLMFNSDMLSSLGMALPHELKETGKWDWASFKDYLISVQSAARDAVYGQDFVPFISGNSYSADAIGFMFANGLKMIDGTNGNYSFGFDNANGIAAVEYLADLYRENLYKNKGTGEFVKNNNAAMMAHESYWATHSFETSDYLPAQDFAYGLIRFPHGPNGDENSVSGYVHHHRRLNWVLKTSGKDIEDIGIVIDFMFEPLDGSEGWQGELKRQVFYTEEDNTEYNYIIENLNFSYGRLYLENGYTDWTNALGSAVTGGKTASEAFESSRTAIQEAINKNVTWTFEELENE
ncbi:MAG: carbohydrate ABC transporter substrate-binding protein [Clostridia bacterium]|nr:carbohydrate ABC transporter substrate-binding protein [Clostridia bacterium]